MVIPAHIWTPWFSLYGSQSGFDSIEECFGQYAKNIFAIETGLSSDPSMNWRIKDLENRAILSFSDAHSGPKLGREATVFELPELSYENIRKAIINQGESVKGKAESNNLHPSPLTLNPNKIAYTIEFYPEEGKYHYTGHRSCNVKQTPSETVKKGVMCPVCGKKLTVGVMHRVEQLAGKSEEELGLSVVSYKLSDNEIETKITKSGTFPARPPYVKLVPLQEIIAEAIGVAPASTKVQVEYNNLIKELGGEFPVLLTADLKDVARISGEKIALALKKVREGDIYVDPGYDGVFGVVKIDFSSQGDKKEEDQNKKPKEQLSLF
jgi:PHP family Zn ribbon phosphoesterase